MRLDVTRSAAGAVAAATIAVTGLVFATEAQAASYSYRSTDYKFYIQNYSGDAKNYFKIYTYIDHKDGYTPAVRSRIENAGPYAHGNRVAIKAYGYRNGNYCMDAINYSYYGPPVDVGYGGWSTVPPYCGAGQYQGNGYGCAEAGLANQPKTWYCYYGNKTASTQEP